MARVARDQRCSLTVAVLGGAVIGLAVGEIRQALTSNEPVAKLDLLVVSERARGQGVGRALLRAFEAWARERGARRLSLTSASHREAAHAFYRSAGWEQTGLRFGRILELPEIGS